MGQTILVPIVESGPSRTVFRHEISVGDEPNATGHVFAVVTPSRSHPAFGVDEGADLDGAIADLVDTFATSTGRPFRHRVD